MPREYREGDLLSAADLNQWRRDGDRHADITAEPPLEVIRGAGDNPIIRDTRVMPFWAKLTGKLNLDDSELSSGCKYSWIEATSSLTTCGMVEVEGGIEGRVDDMPAMAADGTTTLETGTWAYLVLGGTGDHYIIAAIIEGGFGSGSGSGSGGYTCNGIRTSDLVNCLEDEFGNPIMEERCLTQEGGRLVVRDSHGNYISGT